MAVDFTEDWSASHGTYWDYTGASFGGGSLTAGSAALKSTALPSPVTVDDSHALVVETVMTLTIGDYAPPPPVSPDTFFTMTIGLSGGNQSFAVTMGSVDGEVILDAFGNQYQIDGVITATTSYTIRVEVFASHVDLYVDDTLIDTLTTPTTTVSTLSEAVAYQSALDIGGTADNTHVTGGADSVATGSPDGTSLALTQADVAAAGGAGATLSAQALTLSVQTAAGHGSASVALSPQSLHLVQPDAEALTLNAPTLLSPPDGSLARYGSPLLRWTRVSAALSYEVHVALDANFAQRVLRADVSEPQTQVGLEFGRTYYWRVRGVGAGSVGNYSQSWVITVPDLVPAPVETHDGDGRGRFTAQFQEQS